MITKLLSFLSRSGRASVPCASSLASVGSSLRGYLPAMFASAAALVLLQPLAHAIPTWYTIGDSTVQTYTSGYYPRAGWGQVLPRFFDTTKVAIINKAVGGTSSKSFYDSFWAPVRDGLKSGDYVTIQFGINDSATDTARHTDPFTTFESYLTKFCNETKAKGAHPILVATQPRNAWNADGTMYAAYHDYPVATRQLASSLGVPLIDLDSRCKTFFATLGQTYCTWFIYNNYLGSTWPNYPSGNSDNVHFQEMGAYELAKQVVAAIQALSGDANVSKLIPMIKPMYKVSFAINNSSYGLITRTQSFPAGAVVSAYAYANSGHSFVGWTGSITDTHRVSQFTMGTATKSITGTFK